MARRQADRTAPRPTLGDRGDRLGPGRRAFVEIRPGTAADSDARRQGWTRSDRDRTDARRQGWTRSDHGRTFGLEHWEYDADQITGFDYDIGAVLVRSTTVTDETRLAGGADINARQRARSS